MQTIIPKVYLTIFILLNLIYSQPGRIINSVKITATQAGIPAGIGNSDQFGSALASLGDLDGDGVTDLAVGQFLGDDGGTDMGTLYILFLNTDGTVKSTQKITATQAGIPAGIGNFDQFGSALAPLGDLDGDGVTELAVGQFLGDDGGTDMGTIYILFLNTDGTVKSTQRITATQAGIPAGIGNFDQFGSALASLGDLDGDDVNDLAVGQFLGDDGGTDMGTLYILFLNTDGTVKSTQKITATQAGISAGIGNFDQFGSALAALGDLDGDAVTELAVGQFLGDDGGTDMGTLYILFLNTDGTVKSTQKITATQAGVGSGAGAFDQFGSALAPLGDLDGDGITELAVGQFLGDDGGTDMGTLYILFLNTNGTVKSTQKITATQAGVASGAGAFDQFGSALASLGDLDGDGVPELAVGQYLGDDGGTDMGTVYILFLADHETNILTESMNEKDFPLTLEIQGIVYKSRIRNAKKIIIRDIQNKVIDSFDGNLKSIISKPNNLLKGLYFIDIIGENSREIGKIIVW